jgi:hypothetical protein
VSHDVEEAAVYEPVEYFIVTIVDIVDVSAGELIDVALMVEGPAVEKMAEPIR